MQYNVVHAYAVSLNGAILKLDQEVNAMLSKGWKPQGGVTITIKQCEKSPDLYYAVQAMIKES